MKVYDVNLTGTSASETGRAQETQRAERASNSQTAPANASSDRVELSGTLARVARAVSSYSTDRANQVNALTQQYQSGSFRPSSVKTSQGMVAEALSGGTR